MKRFKRPDGFGTPFRRSDGRWIVPFQVGPSRWKQIPVPRAEPVKTPKEALEWATGVVLRQRLDGTLLPRSSSPSGPTVRDLSKTWLDLREADDDVSGATLDGNRSHLDVHILPEFGDVPVYEFGTTDLGAKLGAWIRRLKNEKGPAGRQTVRNIVCTFKVLLDFAISPEGGTVLAANPLRAEWIQRLLPKRRRTDARFATIDDAPIQPTAVQALIDNTTIPLKRRVRYALVFTAPMRDGEIAGLRIRDVVVEGAVAYVDVARACVLNHKDGFAKLGRVKKEWSVRKLPLHQCPLAGLREWIDEGWEEFVGRRPRPDDPLFPREDGKFARPDSAHFFRADLRRCDIADNIGGELLHFHDARGAVATWLKNAHVSDSLIRRFLGHAPVGAAELRYFKGNLLPALVEALNSVPLAWPTT